MASHFWQIVVVLLVIAVAVEGLVIVGLLRQVGALLLHISPRPGLRAEFGGPDLGVAPPGDVPDVPLPWVAVFTSPRCKACDVLVPIVYRTAPHYEDVAFTLIPSGTDVEADYAQQLGHLGRPDLAGLLAGWDVKVTPFAVGVASDGRVVTKGVVNSLDQLEALVEQTLYPVDEQEGSLRKGEPAVDEVQFDGNKSVPIQNLAEGELRTTGARR